MTESGGTNNLGTIFSIATTGGGITTLHSFSVADGVSPLGSLTLGPGGSTLYGMTSGGGADDEGTIFSIATTGGALTTLLSFNVTNGDSPVGDLTLDGSTLYGTAPWGGANNDGVVFSLTVPEPSTFTLLGVGAVGLLGYVWRRRKVT